MPRSRRPRSIRTTATLLLALAVGGCVAPAPVPVGAPPALVAKLPDPRLVLRVTASAATQVRRCYRGPRVPRVARQISTRMQVNLLPDGTLAREPIIVGQGGLTPFNRPYAGMMADAAVSAVIACAPLRLPPELYRGGWDVFELTFAAPISA